MIAAGRRGNPDPQPARFGADVGWQLSFAAVIGIALWAAPVRERILPAAIRCRSGAGPLAEGAALTLAATLATAPLLAHHFETVSLASLPANLLAAPAVAPVMWLGMLAGLGGQLPGLPVEPVTVPMSVLIGWIAAVSEWFSAPAWASCRGRAALAAATAAALRLPAGGGTPRGLGIAAA